MCDVALIGHSPDPLLGHTFIDEAGALPIADGCVVRPARTGTTAASDSLSVACRFPGYRLWAGRAPGHPQATDRGGSPQFPARPCERSAPPTPGSCWASAPGSKMPSVAFAFMEEARLYLVLPQGARSIGAAGFASCCGPVTRHRSFTSGLTLRFDGRDLSRRREPRYRRPWCLPEPDSHRLAELSLSLRLCCFASPPITTPPPEQAGRTPLKRGRLTVIPGCDWPGGSAPR